jgi:hypothetical protein
VSLCVFQSAAQFSDSGDDEDVFLEDFSDEIDGCY